MKPYLNFTGESTITHYEIRDGCLRIKYKKRIVEYLALSNSQKQIDDMIILAQKGNGLYRYIRKNKIKEEGADQNISAYKRLKSIFSFKDK